MKKAVLVFYFMCVSLSVFAQQGIIRELSGTVELKNSGSSSFVPAKVGGLVREDTIISTGFKSSVIIEAGSAVITVRPITRLSFAEIRSGAGTETLNVNLQAGRIRVDVKPPAGSKASMSVISPTATASVRGTSFEIDTKKLSVLEGKVAYISSQGITINVYTGHDSTALTSGVLTNPYDNTRAGFPPSMPAGYDFACTPSGGGTDSSTDDGGIGGINITGW